MSRSAVSKCGLSIRRGLRRASRAPRHPPSHPARPARDGRRPGEAGRAARRRPCRPRSPWRAFARHVIDEGAHRPLRPAQRRAIEVGAPDGERDARDRPVVALLARRDPCREVAQQPVDGKGDRAGRFDAAATPRSRPVPTCPGHPRRRRRRGTRRDRASRTSRTRRPSRRADLAWRPGRSGPARPRRAAPRERSAP